MSMPLSPSFSSSFLRAAPRRAAHRIARRPAGASRWCRGLPALALLAACCAAQAQPAEPARPQGRYLTASGNLEVEVAACGTALCGTVTRVLANRSMHRPGQEMKPADTRPALGMQLLSGFRPVQPLASEADPSSAGAQPTQWAGLIHDRETGRQYDALMSVDASGDLVLRGYVGLPLFGRTQVWHRLAAQPASVAASLPGSLPASSPALLPSSPPSSSRSSSSSSSRSQAPSSMPAALPLAGSAAAGSTQEQQ